MVLRSIFSLKRLVLIYSLPLLFAICLLSLLQVFDRPNLLLLDLAFQWRGTQEPAGKIAIVAISKDDFESGAPRWPWPRSLMARLVDRVSEQQPAVIAIDILYTEDTSTETLITPELLAAIQDGGFQDYIYRILNWDNAAGPFVIQQRDKVVQVCPGHSFCGPITSGRESAEAQDQELADAISKARGNGIAVVLAVHAIVATNTVGVTGHYKVLEEAGGTKGLVGVRPDRDGVVRRYICCGRDEDLKFVYGMALAAAAHFKGVDLPEKPSADGDIPIGDDVVVQAPDGLFLINFRGPAGTYPIFSARDILAGQGEDSSGLKDKIVFIGVTDPTAGDVHLSPFSRAEPMPGVEFHAAAADTLLSGSFIQMAPRYQEFLMLMVFGLGAIALGRFSRPLFGFVGALVLPVGALGIGMTTFREVDYFLPLASTLSAVLAGYTVAVIDRVGVEQLEKRQARSWLSQYLNPTIVEEMVKNPLATKPGAKRFDLTVLFSDIRGFTSVSEKLDPEQLVELLNQYFSEMTEIIFRNEGTVDKFLGDGILAFFGAPQPSDDHPKRAVAAALEMRDRLEYLQEHWQQVTQTALRIGIGINSGEAMVGNIGSGKRMEYTIMGSTVNLASRIQNLTQEKNAPIIISASTQAEVLDMFELQFLGPTPIRGLDQEVDLYQVLDLKHRITD